jgi:hypothetical protein
MRNFRTATLITITLLAVGGAVAWPVNGSTPTTNANIGIEAANVDRTQISATPSETVRSTTIVQPNDTSTKSTVAAPATTVKQPNNSTPKTDATTPSTVKRPGKQKPTATTTVNPPTGDPNRIIENGYINLDGVRVSAVNTGNNGRETYEKCGRIGEQTVKLWFKYADGRIRDERWIFNGKQVNVFRTDQYGNPAWRPVYVEASGLDPYGDAWTEENGYEPTEWIWCANRAPINQ